MQVTNARMPGTSGRSAIPRKPYEGRRQLCNIVEVRFDHILQTHPFDCGDLLVRPGDMLVVQTEKGPQLARAVTVPERRLIDRDAAGLRVLRRASDRDIETAAQLALDGREAMRFALKRVRTQRLPMKLIVVEYMLDRSRALVYFTSESRVDFRNLVRELAVELRVRIEMRQIGVRDGTGILGGIGPCGHELCCSAFLRDFQTVSIREPKEQGITLNPQRITGMCGRLKCCLLYEKQSYTSMRPFTPRRDRSVLTAQGPGSIVEIDALARKIQVRFPGGSVESIHMRDLVVLDRRLSQEELQATMTREEEVLARRRQRTAGGRVGGVSFGATEDNYMWDEVEEIASFFDTTATPQREQDSKADEVTENKRSRSRRRNTRGSTADPRSSTRGKRRGRGGAEASASNAEGQSPDARAPKPRGENAPDRGANDRSAADRNAPKEGSSSSSRRRRRRKPSANAQGGGQNNAQNSSPNSAKTQGGAQSNAPKAAQGGAQGSGKDAGASSGSSASSRRRRRTRRPSGGGGGNTGGGNRGGGSSGGGSSGGGGTGGGNPGGGNPGGGGEG